MPKRRIADSYLLLREPSNAIPYLQEVVQQENVPSEYYFQYAQALRAVENYDESTIWMEKYNSSNGDNRAEKYLKKSNFVTQVFNAKQQYKIKSVGFNTKYSDFGAIEHNDEIYFVSSRDEGVSTKRLYSWNMQPFLDVYQTSKEATNVDHKSKLKGDVNTQYHDGPVTISRDGNTMYFVRNNYLDGKGKDEEGIVNLKIYRASLVNDQWKNITELPFNSDLYSTAHPSLSRDGKKLYFASDMPGGKGGYDIYVVDVNKDGSVGTPQNLGDVINTPGNEVFPFVNNEDNMFFSSDGHVGLGMLDVFASIKDKEGNFMDVVNIGVPANSSKDDFAFFLNEDGITGYISSNRSGGMGDDDIYAFTRTPLLMLKGTVTDAINNRPIPNAKIQLMESGKEIAYVVTDDKGYYEINIDRNTDYHIVGSQDKYVSDSKDFTSRNLKPTTEEIIVDLVLSPVEDVVKLAELDNIYFDFDKHNIRPDAAAELDKIVNLMNNIYPEMVIRIESHTDARGSLSYNDRLSIDRANSTYEYLISKGISKDRITSVEGFGKRRLTNGCDGSHPCEEQAHQLNRRTEFIVVKMKN